MIFSTATVSAIGQLDAVGFCAETSHAVVVSEVA